LAPYRCWLDAEMNAGADVAVVHFDQPVAVSDVDAEALGLLSIESMSGAKRPTVRRVSVRNACSFLQIQAAFGGPYGDGLGQAYGRLAMWQCIAALADTSRIGVRADPQVVPGDKVVQIMEAAEGCTWWRFHDTRWFTSPGFAPGWNTGLAVLRPDGQSLAITACRDQD
jgi:hypothetical protein